VAVIASEVEAIGTCGRKRLSRRRQVATFQNSQVLGNLTYAAASALEAV